MMLLIDVGNSRVKWAWGRGGTLSEQISLAYRGDLGSDWLDAVRSAGKQPQRILISNVAGPRMADALRGLLEKQCRVEPEFASVTGAAAGVTCAYPDLKQLGVDRWLAVIGAWHRAGHAACVIDSGTATTVDAVDDSGTHLGGLILPGLDLMVDALLTRTSDIAQAVDPEARAESGVFADNTLAAIRNGAVLATAALTERAASELAHRTAGEPALYVTGGNATRIAPSLARAHEVVPDLVLHGLAAWGH